MHVRDDSCYINANYVRGFDGVKQFYIATQGPTLDSIAHFWQMVWEQGSTAIVMLTGLSEGGRTKCDRYWPADIGSDFKVRHGDFFITVESVEQVGAHIRTVLLVSNAAVDAAHSDARTIHHFWYNTWPDHGTPHDATGVFALLRDVRLHSAGGAQEPWIVHCSAGIGRTGTFIAIDIGARQLRVSGGTDVLKLIQALREDRGGMVQTDAQAEFVHGALVGIAEDATAL